MLRTATRVLLGILLAACSSEESPTGPATSGAGASGGGVAASTGAGGVATGGSGGAGGAAGGKGGSAGYDCLTNVDYFVEVSGDGAPVSFPFADGNVAPSDAPVAASIWYSEAAPPSLVIGASAGASPDTSSIQLSTPLLMPGMSAMGTGLYHDAAGNVYGAKGGSTFDLTKVDDPGGVVEGSYTAAVADSGGKSLSLSGSFRACRFPDLKP